MPKQAQKKTVSRLRVPPPAADEFVRGGPVGQMHSSASVQPASGATGRARKASIAPSTPAASAATDKLRLHVMISAELWSWSSMEAAKRQGVHQGDIVAEALELLRATREKT